MTQASSRGRPAEGLAQNHRGLAYRRQAITLFELLLVLVLLVVVGSLAAPLFEGSFASIRLRQGTDQVLATWSKARSHAIESGKTYQFRFQPEGSSYRVDPWPGGIEPDTEDETTTISSLDSTSLPDATQPRTEAEIELENWDHEATLPEEIVFAAAERVETNGDDEAQVTRLDQEATTQWSAPIFFYPDGTTSAASLLLKNNRDLYRRATLRALTGVARASDLLSRQEVDRQRAR